MLRPWLRPWAPQPTMTTFLPRSFSTPLNSLRSMKRHLPSWSSFWAIVRVLK